MTGHQMLEKALAYQKIGWSVIPIKPETKIPHVRWKTKQKKRATEAEIKSWYTKWPKANVGIVTGSVSGVVVLDFDSLKALDKFSYSVCSIDGTIIQSTGRGKQVFYRYPNSGAHIKSVGGILKDVDIRADGGITVLPPSVHKSGNRYHWDNIDPTEHGLDDLLDLPNEIKELLNNT